MWPETDPEIWSDFSVRVSSVSSLVGSISGLSLGTKSGWIRRDRDRIHRDKDQIRRGRDRIHRDRDRISSDNSEILPDLQGSGPDLEVSRPNLDGSRRSWSEICKNSLERIKLGLGQVSQVLKRKTNNRPAWGWVRELRTCIRPTKSLDRVATGRTRAGWLG